MFIAFTKKRAKWRTNILRIRKIHICLYGNITSYRFNGKTHHLIKKARTPLMTRLDLYILRMLLSRFAFFVLVFAGLYWINRSILTFKAWLVQGHDITSILHYIILTLPEAIALTAPLSAFIACIVVFVRLINEYEIIILQTLGWSPIRMSMPVFAYGLIVAVLLFFLAGFAAPLGKKEYQKIQKDINNNFSIGLLRPGRFIEPVKDIIIFIGKINEEGEASEWFFTDQRDPETIRIFNAKKAVLVDDEEGPKIFFENGSSQILSKETKFLSNIVFDKTSYNLNEFISPRTPDSVSLRTMTFLELWRLYNSNASDLNFPIKQLAVEINIRLAELLMPFIFSLIALGCLLYKDFNRFGLAFQIVLAFLLCVGLQIMSRTAEKASQDNIMLASWMPYSITLIGFSIGMALLLKAGQKHAQKNRTKRRHRV